MGCKQSSVVEYENTPKSGQKSLPLLPLTYLSVTTRQAWLQDQLSRENASCVHNRTQFEVRKQLLKDGIPREVPIFKPK